MPTQSQINTADINKDVSIEANKLFTLYRTPTETINNESTLAKQEMDIFDAFQDVGILPSYGMYREKNADTIVSYDLRREIPEVVGASFNINSNTDKIGQYDPDTDEFYITVQPTSFATKEAVLSYEKITRQEEQSKVSMIDTNLYSEFTSKLEDEHQATQCQFMEYSLLKSLKASYTLTSVIKNRTTFATTTSESTTNKFTGTYLNIEPVIAVETFSKIKQTLRRKKLIRKNKRTTCAIFCIHEHFQEIMNVLYLIPDVANHYIAQSLSQQMIDRIKAGQSSQVNLQSKGRLIDEKFGTMFDFGDGIKLYSVPDYLASEFWNNTTNKFDIAYVMPEAYTTIDMLRPKPVLGQDWSQNPDRAIRNMPKLGYFIQEKLNAINQGKYIDGLQLFSTSKFVIVPSSQFDKAGFCAMDNSFIGTQDQINALKANYDLSYNSLVTKFGII